MFIRIISHVLAVQKWFIRFSVRVPVTRGPRTVYDAREVGIGVHSAPIQYYDYSRSVATPATGSDVCEPNWPMALATSQCIVAVGCTYVVTYSRIDQLGFSPPNVFFC